VNVLSVRQLTDHLKNLIESDFKLAGFAVRGELSNVSRSPQGHLFFTLKEEGASLSATMFRSQVARCRFNPENGMQVIALGRMAIYEPRGQYQMAVSELRLDGVGELYAAFLQLKEKLAAEGLFDPARKKKLPTLPARIGIVTSEQGAALRDMITTVCRRHPGVSILLSPALVQGAEAPESIIAALRRLWKLRSTPTRVDVIIVGRGGGSFEELNAFNHERVARAIAASPIPTISGVGHETDFTIADLVADARAATPTAAAALATPDHAACVRRVEELRIRLSRALKRRLDRGRERLEGVERRRAALTAERALDGRRRRLDDLRGRLERAACRLLERRQAALSAAAGCLDALSPLKVLSRGYAVCRTASGEVVTRVAQAAVGAELELSLVDGCAAVRVEATAPSREALREQRYLMA
jgi:exodeoxyribonuclease VII large subunit